MLLDQITADVDTCTRIRNHKIATIKHANRTGFEYVNMNTTKHTNEHRQNERYVIVKSADLFWEIGTCNQGRTDTSPDIGYCKVRRRLLYLENKTMQMQDNELRYSLLLAGKYLTLRNIET